jgi:uncharacterized membrane protein
MFWYQELQFLLIDLGVSDEFMQRVLRAVTNDTEAKAAFFGICMSNIL